MVQWLLSGHNPQESSGVVCPASATMIEDMVNAQTQFLLEQLSGGNMSGFDSTVQGCKFVQSRLFMNVEYFTRNLAKVAPFDTASIGVPPDLITTQNHPSIQQYLALGPRLYQLYRQITRIYKNILPGLDQELRAHYWRIRTSNELEPLWAVFAPEFHERLRNIERAHAVNALMVVSLDSLLRQYAPSLMMLFAGRSTATSRIGQHIWALRQTAIDCGPQVCRLLRDGVTDLAAYRTLPAAEPLLQGVDAFLKEYGHRGFRFEYDFETERLADHPEHVLLAVGGQLTTEESPEQRAVASRQSSQKNLTALNPIARWFWNKILAWGQHLISLRESSKSAWSMRQAVYGLAARKLARHFYPDSPDDTLMLYTFPELQAFAASRGKQQVTPEILHIRRIQYELHNTQPTPPELIWYDPDTQKWSRPCPRKRSRIRPPSSGYRGSRPVSAPARSKGSPW